MRAKDASECSLKKKQKIIQNSKYPRQGKEVLRNNVHPCPYELSSREQCIFFTASRDSLPCALW
jgi:hypothetical protein